MGLFKHRPPQREYAVSVEALWGAVKVGLPTVTMTATFDEDAHRVTWTMDKTGFDWAELMSARVEASRDGGAVVTVQGQSAQGFGRGGQPSMIGPGRRRKAAGALLAAVSDVVSRFGEEVAEVPAADGHRYWNGREWTLEPFSGRL
jgi:hypothetical protein